MLAFCASFGMAFASFSVTSVNFDKIRDKEKGKVRVEKYSLKNIHRPISFFSLSSLGEPSKLCDNKMLLMNNSFQLNGVPDENKEASDASDMDVNSTIRLKTGNSVVIYPFSYKVKATPFGLFKAPTPPTR